MRWLLLVALLVVGACSSSTEADSVELQLAEPAVLRPAHPDGCRHTDLTKIPQRWDLSCPGQHGSAIFRFELPASDSSTPHALWFESVGNQAEVRIDGIPVQRLGVLGRPDADVGKVGHVVMVPPGATRPRLVEVEATMQPLRGGGIWGVWYGPASVMDGKLARQRMLHQYAAAAFVAILCLLGGSAAGLWWRQRDALYGCFSLAALFGVVRHLDQVWLDVPIPWPSWGGILAVGYGCHLALTARFVLLLLGINPPWLVRLVHTALAAAVVLPALSFWLLNRELWTSTLVAIQLVGMLCFAVVLREAFRTHRSMAWLLVVCGGLLLVAGLYDIVVVRQGHFGGSRWPLTPNAMVLLDLILAGLVVARHNRAVADHKALNEHLTERVAEREEELRQAFEALRVQRHDQAVLSERQRIMREIHDGIGSQLVGLLSMVGRPHTDRSAIEEQVKLALDEMRMAVDSLQPVHSDLTTVLATLRYRLQGRLESAGIELIWKVEALPPISPLSPQTVLQMQRILLEAFTNVLKHAQATQVVLHAHWRAGDPPAVILQLLDDGIGFAGQPPPNMLRGHGLNNMHVRAASIGAALRVEPAPTRGTCLTLEWPIHTDKEPAIEA
jgi:signal transduction histidine kinase